MVSVQKLLYHIISSLNLICTGLCVLQSKPVESTGTQVLVLGLDGAGKTSLLHCLSTGVLEQDMQPTQGFNAVSINREDLHIEFLESKSQLKTDDQRCPFCFKSLMSLTSYVSVSWR